MGVSVMFRNYWSTHMIMPFCVSGLWGWSCKSSAIARENCALRCLSPACFELIYESDPVRQSLHVIPFSIEFRSDTFFNWIEFFSCSLKREKKTWFAVKSTNTACISMFSFCNSMLGIFMILEGLKFCNAWTLILHLVVVLSPLL